MAPGSFGIKASPSNHLDVIRSAGVKIELMSMPMAFIAADH
jgi:hypothetical protein